MQVRGRRCKKSLVGVAVVELLVLPQEAVLYPQQLLLGGLGGLDLTAGPRPPPRRCCRLEGSFALWISFCLSAVVASVVCGLHEIILWYYFIQNDELIYIWLYRLHCRWSLRTGRQVSSLPCGRDRCLCWALYLFRCFDLRAQRLSKYKACH